VGVNVNANANAETGIISFNENEYIYQKNLYELFNLNPLQINSLNFTISKNGERILLKNAVLLWITYFLIIVNTIIFWVIM